MRDFKFLSDNEEDELEPLPDEMASWMWDSEFVLTDIPNYRWVLQREICHGIQNFLNLFPERYIVPVHSIESNGITHNSSNRDTGWGFDIRNDLLLIKYFSLEPIN
jgi:hypothetical protein